MWPPPPSHTPRVPSSPVFCSLERKGEKLKTPTLRQGAQCVPGIRVTSFGSLPTLRGTRRLREGAAQGLTAGPWLSAGF